MNEDFVFTKEEKVNKLFKVLNVLKNSLQCKRMVVGGSMAMYATFSVVSNLAIS